MISTSCLQCGTPAVRDDATFCRRCGLPVRRGPASRCRAAELPDLLSDGGRGRAPGQPRPARPARRPAPTRQRARPTPGRRRRVARDPARGRSAALGSLGGPVRHGPPLPRDRPDRCRAQPAPGPRPHRDGHDPASPLGARWRDPGRPARVAGGRGAPSPSSWSATPSGVADESSRYGSFARQQPAEPGLVEDGDARAPGPSRASSRPTRPRPRSRSSSRPIPRACRRPPGSPPRPLPDRILRACR